MLAVLEAHACTACKRAGEQLVILDHGWQRTFIGGQSTDLDRLANGVLQLIGQEQMADRGDICATQIERLLDRSCQLRIAELAAHADAASPWLGCRSDVHAAQSSAPRSGRNSPASGP